LSTEGGDVAFEFDLERGEVGFGCHRGPDIGDVFGDGREATFNG
jgi:hypothetical protein